MKRIAFTLDERGLVRRPYADEEIEVQVVCPQSPHGPVYHSRYAPRYERRRRNGAELEI